MSLHTHAAVLFRAPVLTRAEALSLRSERKWTPCQRYALQRYYLTQLFHFPQVDERNLAHALALGCAKVLLRETIPLCLGRSLQSQQVMNVVQEWDHLFQMSSMNKVIDLVQLIQTYHKLGFPHSILYNFFGICQPIDCAHSLYHLPHTIRRLEEITSIKTIVCPYEHEREDWPFAYTLFLSTPWVLYRTVEGVPHLYHRCELKSGEELRKMQRYFSNREDVYREYFKHDNLILPQVW